MYLYFQILREEAKYPRFNITLARVSANCYGRVRVFYS